jgi:hypothetical protein
MTAAVTRLTPTRASTRGVLVGLLAGAPLACPAEHARNSTQRSQQLVR